MNILFFLIPKNDITFIYDDFTLRQALEKMEYHRYTSIPIISRDGKYIDTITEGDILWSLKRRNEVSFINLDNLKIKDIKIHRHYKAIDINKEMADLIELIINQNFVPVIDDRNMFIGIIRRKDVIQYLYAKNQA